MQRKCQVDNTCTGFNKHLYSMNCNLFIKELKYSGIKGSLLNLLASYLTRLQYFHFNNLISGVIETHPEVHGSGTFVHYIY